MSEQATTETTASQAAPVAPAAKPARGITLHDSAVAQLKKLLAERQTPDAGLRLAVRGGGCSGLAYVMEWAEKPREKDK
ncbi:MAG TPA: iron-sulfur cluster biosynthesis family protein, partial [Archangium sp.]